MEKRTTPSRFTQIEKVKKCAPLFSTILYPQQKRTDLRLRVENHWWYVLIQLAKCACLCYRMCVWQLFKLRRGSSMVWTIPLSFISLFHSLSLSVPLPDNSKSRVLLLIFHALLCFLNIPSPPHHFRCFTAAGILFCSYRSTYANFWLDIIRNGA